ncbi:hypothetical protein ABIB73_003955 [Bradyrhizobium sp. F1.4.3]
MTDRAGRARATTGRIRQRAGDENDENNDKKNDKNSPNEFKTDEKGIRP